MADQIVTEGSRSPADVVFTENTPTPPADVPGSNPRDEWITQIHRDTSALLVDAIGEAKMGELRAQDEAMDPRPGPRLRPHPHRRVPGHPCTRSDLNPTRKAVSDRVLAASPMVAIQSI